MIIQMVLDDMDRNVIWIIRRIESFSGCEYYRNPYSQDTEKTWQTDQEWNNDKV